MKKPPVHNNQYFAMSNVIIIQMLDFNGKKKTIHKFENIVPKLYVRFLYASPLIMTRAHSFFPIFPNFTDLILVPNNHWE